MQCKNGDSGQGQQQPMSRIEAQVGCLVCRRLTAQHSPNELAALPYLTLPAGWMPVVKQTPSTEATAWAQCATPTDLKVDRTS